MKRASILTLVGAGLAIGCIHPAGAAVWRAPRRGSGLRCLRKRESGWHCWRPHSVSA